MNINTEDDLNQELARLNNDLGPNYETQEEYPKFPNRTITDEESAALYLEDWTISEFGDDWDGESKPDRQKEINDELIKAGYPGTEDMIYDNEGAPMIYWTDPNFDHDAWVEKWNQEHESQ